MFLGCKCLLSTLAMELGQPDFIQLIQTFLYDQLSSESGPTVLVNNDLILQAHGKISIYVGAIPTFHVPSDLSGIGGI
jgi:hypothetical protein